MFLQVLSLESDLRNPIESGQTENFPSNQHQEENCCPKKKLDKQNDSEVCEWQLMCKICNKVTNKTHRLKIDLEQSNNYSDFILKRCNDNESLVEHMKVAHKKQRPFFCRLCNCVIITFCLY